MGEWESVRAENLVRHRKSGNYHLRAKVGGKIYRKSLKTKKIHVAKVRRDDLLLSLRSESGVVASNEKLALGSAIDLAWAHYQATEAYQKKPASLEYRRQQLTVARRTLPKGFLSTWTVADLERWWQSPEVKRYSATRRNGLLGTVRKIMELAIESGARHDDPTSGIRILRVRPSEISVPSADDFRRIVASIREQNKRASHEVANLVEFLAYSGGRISEAGRVTWSDVSASNITFRLTKNHETRRVPIIPQMADLLGRVRSPDSSGPLFSVKTPRMALNGATERLGIAHVRVHDLRHLFATTCIESGVDIPTLSRWLGHKDGGALAMKTYGHLRDEHSQSEAAKVRF